MKTPLYWLIKEKFQLGPANHMTHIKNFPNILREKRLLSYNQMNEREYFSLANEDVQKGRAQIRINETNRPLHDYVPLYFGFKTPMVACNQHQNEQLLFLLFSLDLLNIPGTLISDGNARASKTTFRAYRHPDDLKFLNIKAILTVKYTHDSELKRQKQAEVIVPDSLPLSYLYSIICFSPELRQRVLANLAQVGINHVKVKVNPGWYFN